MHTLNCEQDRTCPERRYNPNLQQAALPRAAPQQLPVARKKRNIKNIESPQKGNVPSNSTNCVRYQELHVSSCLRPHARDSSQQVASDLLQLVADSKKPMAAITDAVAKPPPGTNRSLFNSPLKKKVKNTNDENEGGRTGLLTALPERLHSPRKPFAPFNHTYAAVDSGRSPLKEQQSAAPRQQSMTLYPRLVHTGQQAVHVHTPSLELCPSVGRSLPSTPQRSSKGQARTLWRPFSCSPDKLPASCSSPEVEAAPADTSTDVKRVLCSDKTEFSCSDNEQGVVANYHQSCEGFEPEPAEIFLSLRLDKCSATSAPDETRHNGACDPLPEVADSITTRTLCNNVPVPDWQQGTQNCLSVEALFWTSTPRVSQLADRRYYTYSCDDDGGAACDRGMLVSSSSCGSAVFSLGPRAYGEPFGCPLESGPDNGAHFVDLVPDGSVVLSSSPQTSRQLTQSLPAAHNSRDSTAGLADCITENSSTYRPASPTPLTFQPWSFSSQPASSTSVRAKPRPWSPLIQVFDQAEQTAVDLSLSALDLSTRAPGPQTPKAAVPSSFPAQHESPVSHICPVSCQLPRELRGNTGWMEKRASLPAAETPRPEQLSATATALAVETLAVMEGKCRRGKKNKSKTNESADDRKCPGLATALELTPDQCLEHWQELRRTIERKYRRRATRQRGSKRDEPTLQLTLNSRAVQYVQRLKEECPEQKVQLVSQGFVLVNPFVGPRDTSSVRRVQSEDSKNSYVCVINGKAKSHSDPRAVNRDLDRHREKFMCIFCPPTAVKKGDSYDLTRHMRIHTKSNPYKCRVTGCKKTAAADTGHVRRADDDSTEEEDEEEFGSSHTQLVSLNQHLMSHHKEVWRRIEEVQLRLKEKAEALRRGRGKGAQAGRKADVKEDQSLFLDDIPQDLRWYSFSVVKDHICELCGTIYRDVAQYIQHLRARHARHPHLLRIQDRRIFPVQKPSASALPLPTAVPAFPPPGAT